MHPDSEDHADEDQQDEERLRPPAGDDGADGAEDRQGEARDEEPRALLKLDGRLQPGSEPVAPVEVPVAEPAHDLGGERGSGDGGERLGVLQDVDAVGAFYAQPDDPEQRDPERENAQLQAGARRAAGRRLVEDERAVEEPGERREADVDQRRGIGRSHERDHDREQRRIAPSAAAKREHGEGDHPPQTGPGQQDRRDPLDVLEEVRRELVGKTGDDGPRAGDAERPGEVEDASAGREQERPHPKPLGYPDRHTELSEDPVERPLREQVPNVLMGDRPGGDGRVPHRDSRAEEPSRVEVEVLLGVGGDDAGLGEEQRDVGEGGEKNVFQEPDHELAGPARWSHGPVSLGAHVRARRDIRAAHRPRVSSVEPPMIVVGLTGGIGSGKTYVGARLVERGAVLIDADVLAREVVEPGRPAYGRVVERFGSEVVAPDGKLDRAAIAAIVFNDAQALADLNAIVHPEVGVEIAARLATESAGDHVVVLDIPLLVEAGNAERYPFDGVLVVDAPVDLVLDRLVSVRGMERADAEARIANQASREERIRAADFVIMNMGSFEELDEMVARAWAWIEGLQAEAGER